MSGRWTAQLDGTTGGQQAARWGGATALTPCIEGGAACALRMPEPRVSSTLLSPLACFCAWRRKSAFGSWGNRNKNTCSLSQPLPHPSAVASSCRETRTDRQNLHWRLHVCTPDSPGERRPWLAHAKTSERGEECRADTKFRHAQRASRTALDIGREGGCPTPSGYLLSPGRAVQLRRLL